MRDAARLGDITLTLGSALITGIVAIAVPILQERLRAEHDAKQARAERRQKAIDLAVRMRTIAEEANLDGYVVNTTKEHYEYLQTLSRRLADVRDPLIALAAVDDDETALDAVREALNAVRRSIHTTALSVEDMIKGKAPSDTFVNAAQTQNPEAIKQADALINRFRAWPVEKR